VRPARSLPTLAASVGLAVALLAPASPAAAAGFPETVPLPDASSPEGISGGPGTTYFAGSRVDGSVVRGDLRTGEFSTLVPGQQGAVAVGMLYDHASGLLWVAGGGTGTVTAYDGRTGERVFQKKFAPAGDRQFLNDVTITRDAVYVTDSFSPRLLVVDLGPGGRPTGAREPLVLQGFTQPAGFGLNGIRTLPGGDLVVVSSAGGLFRIDRATGATTQLLSAAELPSGDGLELRGSTLYVVNAFPDAIGVVRITPKRTALIGTLTDDDLERPTTATFAAGALWAVNGKFNTPGATQFEVVRVGTR
jgi:sugar lactone lactonase YvrE